MFELWVNFLMGLGIYWEEFGYEVSEWNGVLDYEMFMLLTVAVLLVQAGWRPGDLTDRYRYSRVSVFKLQSPFCQVFDTDTVKYGFVYHSGVNVNHEYNYHSHVLSGF